MYKIVHARKPYQIILFCFQDTFKDAKTWVNKLREEKPSILIVLAGNKTDLAPERQVKFEVSYPHDHRFL